MRLFILEDNTKQAKLYKDSIEEFSKNKGIGITYEFSDNIEETLEKLKKDNFDAAIIDLKLGGTDTEGKGNKAIREIIQNLRFPVFVMTGFRDELDTDLRTENVFYKIYVNTDKNISELLGQITELYNTGITKILGKKGKIDVALQEIFWKHIGDNLNYWKEEIKDPKDCEKVLLRHIVAYLSGYLEMDEAGELLCYNPAEFYIIPPIRKYIFTGDIIKKKDDGKLYVVLTPACDIAQGKAKDVTIVYIEDKNMQYLNDQKNILTGKISDGATEEQIKENKQKKEEAEKIIKGLLTNSHSFKYHFLPSTRQFPGGFINFQKTNTVKLTDIPPNYDRIASITEKFIKDIIARFSHYYARQGQPDFNIEELKKKILEG